jgi:hypothetical protein
MENPEAEEVWNTLFPGASVQVHWNAFISIFETYFRSHFPSNCQPHVTFTRILRHAITLNGSYVTKIHFTHFLNLFGPLRLSLVKVCSNLFDSQGILFPWFHGSLSRDQSKTILNSLTEGHYLVRLSESQPGKFTLVYVASDNQPKNILIYNHQESGYGLDGTREHHGEGRIFDNLAGHLLSLSVSLSVSVSPCLSLLIARSLHCTLPGEVQVSCPISALFCLRC